MENARQKPAAPSRAGRTEAAIPDSIEDENELDDNNMNEEEEDTNFVDNDGDDSDQEDPVAEGEEAPAAAPFQPSYEKANSLRFFDVCKRLEYLWRVRRHGKKLKTKPTTVSQLKAILPPQLLAHLANSNSDNSGLLQSSMSPQSIFPLFRLLMPEKDSSRSFLMKETELAKAYAAAFNLPPTSLQKLLHYGDPHIITNSANVGDFSVVLQEILKGRLVYDTTGKTGSDWTVGHINAVLDDLAGLSQKTRAAKDAYFEQKAKEQQQQATTALPSKRPRTLSQNRAEWVRSLHKPPPGGKKLLTPLEHKWLVRIVQGQMQFGLTWKTLLNWYNVHAVSLYDAHTSLKAICRILCDPDFSSGLHSRRQSADDSNMDQETSTGIASYMPTSAVDLSFGTPFTPMLSARTSFDRMLDDVSRRHRAFAKEQQLMESLSFRNPALSVETKLDGERMVIHINREGIVKIHSRVGNWYSGLYSPVLGPALRRATAKYSLDIILDGEILAWDNGREETIPFGQNRSVANLRRSWMSKQSGTRIDDRDVGLHGDEQDAAVVRSANFSNRDAPDKELAGEECWLVYFAFDVMYIDGPDAAKLLEETVSEHVQPRPSPGTIIQLDGFERKKLLYKLINAQKNEVEIVPTWIIRPTGDMVVGSDYFSPNSPLMECGHPACDLDSLCWTLNQDTATVRRLDSERRRGQSNDEISHARAAAADKIYQIMVEHRRMEGLLFKDLSAPYYLGEKSKSLKYWHKFKPDYYSGSVASDIDCVIIGAYFATGLRNAGRPSTLLCACVDSEDTERFFTLCKVNAGSMRKDALDDLFQSTGFYKDEETGRYDRGDKWFVEEDRKTIPDFVTSRSNQPGQEGWRPKKADYPDMWIHPSDSRILTLNAGEIISSDAFSAGVTLRFPRVTALRSRSEKPVSEVESELTLWEIYQKNMESRSDTQVAGGMKLGSPSPADAAQSHRFLTEEQFANSKKRKRKSSARTRKEYKVVVTADADVKNKSMGLHGMVFTVLKGTYRLDESSIDIDEAVELGWLEHARSISSSEAMEIFIKEHGGTVAIAPGENTYVIGGREGDPKVNAFVRAIENACAHMAQKKTKKQTQKDVRYSMMAKQQGVLRWPSLFDFVYRKLSGSIGKNDTLQPTLFDYLARPSRAGSESILVDLCAEDIQTTRNLKRALDLIGKSQSEEKDEQSWQQRAVTELEPEERWVACAAHQGFWPYSRDGGLVHEQAILYPDIYNEDSVMRFNCKNLSEAESMEVCRAGMSSRIASVLPLVRIMGAVVSSELHVGVTHVLCDLCSPREEVELVDHLSPEIFSQPTRGRQLLQKLLTLHAGAQTNATRIMLVSPRWIRKRKWCDRYD